MTHVLCAVRSAWMCDSFDVGTRRTKHTFYVQHMLSEYLILLEIIKPMQAVTPELLCYVNIHVFYAFIRVLSPKCMEWKRLWLTPSLSTFLCPDYAKYVMYMIQLGLQWRLSLLFRSVSFQLIFYFTQNLKSNSLLKNIPSHRMA
jgi:hypothetical protein